MIDRKRLFHWCATLVAFWVLLLIGSGGLVTSHEAGMSVPDWPNTFGYNMFLFPVTRWVGGVFFEHTHRLAAFCAGLLTLVLFILSLAIEKRTWIKVMAGSALAAVVVQAVLGGLRVIEHNPLLGFFHGLLAQSYFSLTVAIAVVTSRFWLQLPLSKVLMARAVKLRNWTITVTAMLFIQLMMGAAMRHSHAGLSIHDFPTVYGGILPPLDAGSLAKINATRGHLEAPTSAPLILLQYAHRLWAVAIAIGLIAAAIAIYRSRELHWKVRTSAVVWGVLVFVQIGMGAWTVLSNKAADVATGHVVVGAVMLMIGVCLSVILAGTASAKTRDAQNRLEVATV
jgi:heme a synthase